MIKIFLYIQVLSVSVMTTLGMPQYVEPPEIEGNLDDAYQFAYAVASPEHGDYHGHQQSRDENGFTSGSYYLLGADGQWSQTIFADKGAGYQAIYNQRPAGAPPPQVSEVTYQIFVHPGATAISAQGGGAPAPPPVPAPLGPFGGIQQKSLQGNNQVNQAQVRQQQQQQQQRFNNAQRFNRETQVAQSSNPQLVQPSIRFNRDTQVSESANSYKIPVEVSPDNVQTSARQPLSDLQVSPSRQSNIVRVPAPHIPITAFQPIPVARAVALPPRQQPRRLSIFRQPISNLLKQFMPKPHLQRQ